MGGQGLDAFKALQDSAAGLSGGLGAAGRLEQVVGGHIERGGEPENHVGIQTQLAALVAGNEGLDEAGFPGELHLREASFAAEARETSTWRVVAKR